MPSITHNEPFFFLPLSRSGTSPRRPCSLEWRRPRRSRVPPAAPLVGGAPDLAGAAQSPPPPPPPVWSGPEHVAPPRPRWYVPQIDAGAPRRRPRPVRPSLLVLHHRSSPSPAATPRPHVASGQARTQGARRPHHRSPWCSTGRARPSLLSATSSSSIYDSSDQICKAGTKISPLSLLLCDRCISNVQN
jgi:hypothetical protein